jgi:hypothetical protein
MSLNSVIGGDVDDDPLKAWEKAGSVLYQHHLLREENRTEKFNDQIVASAWVDLFSYVHMPN